MPPTAAAVAPANYDTLVRAVATTLLTEAGHSLHHLHHASPADMRELVQPLLVMRPPPEDNTSADAQQEERLYAQMDAVLALEQQRQTLVDAAELPPVATRSSKLSDTAGFDQIALWKGDITTLRATAIGNAANSALLGCFQPSHRCIDNVIHSKAGPRLRAACQDIMTRQARDEPVGSAKITPGFALPAKYVLHTVGPQLQGGQPPTTRERAQLESCYTRSLDLLLDTVKQNRKEEGEDISVAFPCISTGLFAFPSDEAVPLAVDAVREWLKEHEHETRGWKVIFNTFLKRDYALYKSYLESQCPVKVTLPAAPVSPAIEQAWKAVQEADFLLVAGGAGLSAAAGLDYTSEAVMRKFHPGIRQVLPSFRTMYHSIGFTKWSPAVMWGYLFKQISVVRFDWLRHRTAPTYSYIKTLVDAFEKKTFGSTFIKTSNADGMFEQEGFCLESVFPMQGEYGRIQCVKPCSQSSIFDVKPFMDKAMKSFNPSTYRIEDPAGLPKCPKCGGDMFLHLRVDDSFLQSAIDLKGKVYCTWLHNTLERVKKDGKKLVILEVGAGFNTPGVLRIPDERLALNDGVQLVRVNTEYPEMPFDAHGVSVGEDANLVLEYLARKLTSD